MRTLVTGGAGFVGSHIVYRHVSEGDDVLVVDNLSTGKHSNMPPEARLEEIDIVDPELSNIVSSFRPDLVTHCAAQASVPTSMADPLKDARVNIIGGINVLEATIKSDCRKFIYITTGGALYGTPEYLPCDEDHPIRPESAYGLSKWTLEHYLKLLILSSMQLNILRLANVYGPRQDPHGEAGVIAIFGLLMVRGQQVVIYGDGEQTRDFISVTDVVDLHHLSKVRADTLTLNVGSGQATSINMLFNLMAQETNYKLLPVYKAERPGDIKHVVLDNSRARKLLGWEPTTTMETGIEVTLNWLRSQN